MTPEWVASALNWIRRGNFLSDDGDIPTPPWATLRALEEATRRFENDEDALNEKWLKQLLRPSSSLGGASPKATVVDTDGQLWIAKFPSKNDENNTGAWEKTVHDLARMCGLNVPESKLETFSKLGSTLPEESIRNLEAGGNDSNYRGEQLRAYPTVWGSAGVFSTSAKRT